VHAAKLKIIIRIDRQFLGKVGRPDLRRALQTAFRVAEVAQDSALCLVITGDEEIRRLNRDFRHIDEVTDVLSFGAESLDELGFVVEGPRYLGDIIISFQRSAEQAEIAGHPVDEELWLLAVHGLLHLLGYDHGENEDRQTMWALQGAALDALGISWRP
jgi:probable rRNA maturation factor